MVQLFDRFIRFAESCVINYCVEAHLDSYLDRVGDFDWREDGSRRQCKQNSAHVGS